MRAGLRHHPALLDHHLLLSLQFLSLICAITTVTPPQPDRQRVMTTRNLSLSSRPSSRIGRILGDAI